MIEGLLIALKFNLHSLAQAHVEDGQALSLAWQNLYVIGQLALVCKRWHKLVCSYANLEVIIAVDEMFEMVAKRCKILLLQNANRSRLPHYLMRSCSRYNDHEYDNMSAVAIGMHVWRPKSFTRKDRTPSISPSISYDILGRVKSIEGDWFSLWRRGNSATTRSSAMTLKLNGSTSAMKINTLVNENARPQRRSKTTEDLQWVYFWQL